MQEANTLSISELFEKGCVEYLGLGLMGLGAGWIILSFLESFKIVVFSSVIFDRLASIVVYSFLGLLLISLISSYRTLKYIRKETSHQKSNK